MFGNRYLSFLPNDAADPTGRVNREDEKNLVAAWVGMWTAMSKRIRKSHEVSVTRGVRRLHHEGQLAERRRALGTPARIPRNPRTQSAKRNFSVDRTWGVGSSQIVNVCYCPPMQSNPTNLKQLVRDLQDSKPAYTDLKH